MYYILSHNSILLSSGLSFIVSYLLYYLPSWNENAIIEYIFTLRSIKFSEKCTIEKWLNHQKKLWNFMKRIQGNSVINSFGEISRLPFVCQCYCNYNRMIKRDKFGTNNFLEWKWYNAISTRNKSVDTIFIK